MIVYARRNGAPTSPQKTLPRLTPMRSGEPARLGGDLAQREQHPLLVVADHARRAGGQRDLAAVRVHVGLQEADLELVRDGLDVADELARSRPRPPRAPPRAISASTPSKRRKAVVTTRCSGCGWPPATCARTSRERKCSTALVGGRTGSSAGPGSRPFGAEVSSQPSPALGAQPDLGHAAAVAAEIAISPAPAQLLHADDGGRAPGR